MEPFNTAEIKTVDPSDKVYEDRYLDGLDWNPQSALHGYHVSRMLELAHESSSAISPRHSSWNLIDRNLTGYVPLDEDELDIKSRDQRKPMSVVVPMTFAAREAMLTYFTNVFLNRDIVLPLKGVGPEDSVAGLLFQHVLQQQAIRGNIELGLHTQWSDSFTYGLGIMAPQWKEEVGQVTTQKPAGFFDFVQRFRQTGQDTSISEEIIWQGHEFKNIDPYNYLPDPNMPPQRMQDGEYVGWVIRENYMTLLAQESQDPSMFNVKYLLGQDNKTTAASHGVGRERREHNRDDANHNSSHPIDVVWFYRKLIPAMEGLGESELPEKWLFALAGDKYIIKAQRLGLEHNMFPLTVCSPDYDGYSIAPISRLEIIYGLQEQVDWLFSSHIANVRKTINDTLIVDPMRINMKDMIEQRAKAGGLIRTRRAQWGRGVQDAIVQLKTQDVTRGHIPDAQHIMTLMNQVTGASESLQGVFDNAPERRTKAEFQSTAGNAASRMSKMARVANAMSIRPLTQLMASHTKQFMTQETYIDITGDLERRLIEEYDLGEEIKEGRLKIRPQDININTDIMPSAGRSNADNDAQTTFQMLQLAVGNPLIFQSFDTVRMFKHLARQSGMEDIDDFQVKLVPQSQEQINRGIQDNQLRAIGAHEDQTRTQDAAS